MTSAEQTNPAEFLAASVEVSHDSVGTAFIRTVRSAPEAPALQLLTPSGVASLSWAELYRRASGAAMRLRELDPERGRVALIAYNSIDWIVAMYGCALAGRSVVPISPAATDAEATHMLNLARVTTVLVVERVGQDHTVARLEGVARRLARPPEVRDIAEFNTVSDILVEPAHVDATDEFLLQFTSGTTGVPKAAVLSHRAAINCAQVYARGCTVRTGEVWLNPLPLFHVGGLVTGLLVAMAHGGAYIVLDRFSTEVALRALREIRPALVGLVPTMIIDLLAVPGVSASDFASVRLVIAGATAVDPGLIAEMENRLGITFMVAYGQSEAPAMAVSAPEDSPRVRTRSMGRCLPGRDYRIRDNDGNTVPFGVIGELCVRGPLTMTGYLRPDGGVDPAADEQGWRRSGDLCSMDADGVLTFHGRIREMIIRGGLNIFPAEVERALSAHESVTEAAVFGVPDIRLGERVVAAVLAAVEDEVDIEGVRALLEDRLSRYKRPAELIVVRSLPRTSTGKVRKHQLREWYQEGTLIDRCG
ncbi:class I adenylate-forming enzyme family protein [Nocardia barduliensis]|uniref:class I adenylate-forming enzyme family protein n=1 Tax=Nocardia barduliensis TaxID=2736643 RepID=UPI0015740E25|nr:class I adenylate-forming enzyme family protein [Nocardia barduliensis]